MVVPDTLAHRMKLFTDNAMAFKAEGEIFRVDSWTQVMFGQRIMPRVYHPIVDAVMTDEELHKSMEGYAESVKKLIAQLPTHGDFVKKYCSEDMQ